MGIQFERPLYCGCLAEIFKPYAVLRHGKYIPVVILPAHAIFHCELSCGTLKYVQKRAIDGRASTDNRRAIWYTFIRYFEIAAWS